MSVSLVTGVIASIATPTCSDAGAVQLTDGAARSTATLRVTARCDSNPAFIAVTVTDTPVPAIQNACAGTLTDHAPSGPEVVWIVW